MYRFAFNKSKLSGLSIALSMLFAITGGPVASAHDVFVAPDGNDQNLGTLNRPLATLEAARNALRQSSQLGKEPCRVILQEGVYRLSRPFRLTPRDGGVADAEVTYMAAEGATVTLTSASMLRLQWEPWKGPIFRAQVDSAGTMDQLFVNGERQLMARYPNAGPAGSTPFNGSSPDAWDFESRGWKNPRGAFLHALHQSRWGGAHYEVTGVKDGQLEMAGGWQNNRAGAPHETHRMAENVFEELDAPGEWFLNSEEKWLYYYPAEGIDLAADPVVEAVCGVPHLIEIYGDLQRPMPTMTVLDADNGMDEVTFDTPVTETPVSHIRIKGIRFTGTARTFMDTREPLLRSDWTIYRGGAVHLRGTEDILVADCRFEQLGGNAVFVDGYNRRVTVKRSLFDRNGATDVNFVGSPADVRNPRFGYMAPRPDLETVDTQRGPKGNEYPADCLVEDNLMSQCGRVEKQSSGVNLAMASRITVSHNTIHHVPRAAINICSGTWGGHVIEYNDCFETVLETGDHGAFNSWARDRFWFPASPKGAREAKTMRTYLERYPDMMRWDACETIILRNNRMHSDHGWDIDLDDGATNYEIYNNVCLQGGLKTREGYYRTVYNNIILGRFTCNVSYDKPTYDLFERNILVGARYTSNNLKTWGGLLDATLFHDPQVEAARPAAHVQELTGQDAGSLVGNARFADPANGDFTVGEGAPALKLGFKNFPMNAFGVTSAHLKALAPKPVIRMPTQFSEPTGGRQGGRIYGFMGAKVKKLETESELTAYGASSKTGMILLDVPPGSPLAQYGFESDDVILKVNGKEMPNLRMLRRGLSGKGTHDLLILRGQAEKVIQFRIN